MKTKIRSPLFRPKTLVAVFAIGILAALVYWADSDTSDRREPALHILETETDTLKPVGNIPQQAVDGVSRFLRSGNPTDAELSLQHAWEKERGYFTIEQTYLREMSNEELESLALQGDTRAMRVLAGRHLWKDPEAMMEFYELAAVHGDTSSLLSAASTWSLPHVFKTVKTFRVSENNAVNTLALILTAQIRGDNVLAPQQLHQLLTDVTFSEEMRAEACLAAELVYEKLESKRAGVGLNYFDDAPSPLGQSYDEGAHTKETCSQN